MRLHRLVAPLSLVLAAALSGCQLEMVREHPLGCRSDEQPLVRDTLYLGRSIPGGGSVDEAAWSAFEADVVSPAFPDGYSVLDAHGRWRGKDGATVGEDSRLLVLVHHDGAASAQAVRKIAAAYKARFRQESVLRERTAVCANF